jgi:hypothetical protein
MGCGPMPSRSRPGSSPEGRIEDAFPTQGACWRPSASTSSSELTSRETYQWNLSPRIPGIRISSKRQPNSSPQVRRRSRGALLVAALYALTRAPLQFLPIGRSRPLAGAPSASFCRGPWRGERLRPGRADVSPEARAVAAACSLFETGVFLLLSMRLSGVRWGTTAHRGGPLLRPTEVGRSAWREKQFSKPRRRSGPGYRGSDCRPSMTSDLDR